MLTFGIRDLINLLPSRQRAHSKNQMRELLSQKRRIMTSEQVAESSALIIAQLQAHPLYQQASRILVYYPIHHEVDLRELMQTPDKQFYLPVAHRHSLEIRPYVAGAKLKRGKFGIPEPTTAAYKGKLDLIIVPGVAFDHHCNRLGRGGGYYDRFLRSYRHTPKLGVGYDFQYVELVPTSWNDIKMDGVVTPNHTASRQ